MPPLNDNLRFRSFVGLNVDEPVRDVKSFKKVEEAEEQKPETGDDDAGNPRVDFRGEERSHKTHPFTAGLGGLVVQTRSGQGGPVELRRPRVDGEPEWAHD
jgi:hypothetical protein